MNNTKRLYYEKIEVSEGINVNKTSESKECDACHCWYFLSKGFKIQPNVCNEFLDFLMMSQNLNDIAILNNKSADYHSIIDYQRNQQN